MTAVQPYGTHDPLGHEPGAPVPVVQKPPASSVPIIAAAVASVGASSAGAAVSVALIQHGDTHAVLLILIASLYAAVTIVRHGMAGRNDNETPAYAPEPGTPQQKILELIEDGAIDVAEGERLLRAIEPGTTGRAPDGGAPR